LNYFTASSFGTLAGTRFLIGWQKMFQADHQAVRHGPIANGPLIKEGGLWEKV
jgi:hypothetical protein